jgi:hypothetical protein
MSVRALTLLRFHVMVLPAGTGSLALGAGEVEGLLQDDNTSGRITKVRDQLGVGLGMYCQQSSFSQYNRACLEKFLPWDKQALRFRHQLRPWRTLQLHQ